MGALIESARVLAGRQGPFGTTAMKLTDAVARQCLERAGLEASDLEILVNAGIYHDRNIGEPAVAALIQGDLGANARHPAGGHGTFSFDLLNGAAGVVSAAFVVDGLVRAGVVSHGMVVAADVDPDPGGSVGVSFSPAGGALLLGAAPPGTGFVDFAFEDFPEHENLYASAVSWRPSAGPHLPGRPAGRNRLEIAELPGYLERSVECTARAARAFLQRSQVMPSEIDLLVAAHTSPGFADRLADALGMPRTSVSHVTEAFERAHTAQVIAAWAQAETAGRLKSGHLVLLATAGAGISVGLALYRVP